MKVEIRDLEVGSCGVAKANFGQNTGRAGDAGLLPALFLDSDARKGFALQDLSRHLQLD
jgi:hypothetical protein